MSTEENLDKEPKSEEASETVNETISQNKSIEQQSEIMEVYHHPDLHHRKKHWKEYFLEFIMIFLAVTLGFFAESVRQYISDKEHVRRLCGQLVQDLKNDSAILDNNISREILLIKKTDTLFYLLQQPIAKTDSKKLQELIITCYNINLFQPSSGAISAIKNELHLKLFANSNITSYISDYETAQALLKTIEKFHEENLKEYIQGFISAHFTSDNAYSSLNNNGLIVNGNLRNISQNDLTQLSVDLAFVKSFNKELAEVSGQLKAKASYLIEYVHKEFD